MKLQPKNGKIPPDTFVSYLKEVGQDWLISQVVHVIDKNDDGIDFAEFMTWFYLLSRGSVEERRKCTIIFYAISINFLMEGTTR